MICYRYKGCFKRRYYYHYRFWNQYPGETLAEGLKNWHEKADGKCSCDYSFHMSITDWNPSVSKEVQDMMDEGITSFKLYMTYDTQVDDKTLFEILQRLKETGGITGVHCENSGMIAALQEEAKAAGKWVFPAIQTTKNR